MAINQTRVDRKPFGIEKSGRPSTPLVFIGVPDNELPMQAGGGAVEQPPMALY